MSITASRCCCGLLVLLKLVFCCFQQHMFRHEDSEHVEEKGNSWCEYSGPSFLTKMLSVVPQQQQRAACEWVWSTEAPADGDVGHNFSQTRPQWNSTENTDITTVGTSCIFNTAVSVWAKFLVGAVCPTGRSTINSSPSISQSLTNVTLFSAARAQYFFSGASHCHFAVLKLPECSNSKLCSLKEHASVYFCTIIPKLPGAV